VNAGKRALPPEDPDFATRVRASFEKQTFMTTIGARLASVEPGRVVVELPFRSDLVQQHGFVHAGALASIADSACGYAALSLMPKGSAVLSVEFKVNLMRPATGSMFRAVGQVVRAGRSLTVCTAEVHAEENGRSTVVTLMQATMMSLRDRGEMTD
jgi:uncharacterized protein (TIGR00369 family)